jgi:AcrR family transcriptional regulator
MQAVAKRAKVSVGLAYHHFGSKAGLIAAVVEAFYSRLDAEAFNDAGPCTESWANRERRRIACYIAFHYDHPFAPLVIGALSRAPEVLDVERFATSGRRRGMIERHSGGVVPIASIPSHHRAHDRRGAGPDQCPDSEQRRSQKLTDEIWAFWRSPRLAAGAGIEKTV